MTTIIRTAKKDWTGPPSASTILFSVPRALWAGRASLVALRGSGWARVLDGNSAAFQSGPANFGDHPTMRAYTDKLVLQFMSENDSLGSATGVFESQSDVVAPIRPGILAALKVASESAFISRSAEGPRAVHRYVVLEGAEPLSDGELAEYLEGVDEFERLSLDPESVIAMRLEQLRDS
jgi:hypothetical protein